MTKHFKIRCTTAFLVFTGFTALLMLSCGGCGSGKVQKLTSDLQKINDYSLQANDDTVKYLFMDDPILSKLKLTRIPKS
ncbi:MAG: hypothetical protein IPM26_04705 [Saprospiraceae bacterium]|nr:hypothetical protein [Saprospiraceae bacterium]